MKIGMMFTNTTQKLLFSICLYLFYDKKNNGLFNQSNIYRDYSTIIIF